MVSGLPFQIKHLERYIVSQNHDQYTADDRLVWNDFVIKRLEFQSSYTHVFHSTYVDAFTKLGLNFPIIPLIESLDDKLQSVGWRAVCVENYIPAAAYAELLSHRVFPVSRGIRCMEYLDHAPTPDFIHDVVGHLPMLFVKDYRDYLVRLGRLTLQAAPNLLDRSLYKATIQLGTLQSNLVQDPDKVAVIEKQIMNVKQQLLMYPSELTHLNRIFNWSIEYGLMGKTTGFKVIGARLISSEALLRGLIIGGVKIVDYSADAIRYEVELISDQSQLFVSPSFAHYNEILDLYSRTMACKMAESYAS